MRLFELDTEVDDLRRFDKTDFDDIEELKAAREEVRENKRLHINLLESTVDSGSKSFRFSILIGAAIITALSMFQGEDSISNLNNLLNDHYIVAGFSCLTISIIFSAISFITVPWKEENLRSHYELTPKGNLENEEWIRNTLDSELNAIKHIRYALKLRTVFQTISVIFLLLSIVFFAINPIISMMGWSSRIFVMLILLVVIIGILYLDKKIRPKAEEMNIQI